MPTTYPPAPPTLSGDVLTINRFLNSPTMLMRALRTLAMNRFIADTLLQARPPVSGGAVLYEQSETIFADRTPKAIEPGAEFPLSTITNGTALLAAVKKWGLDSVVTDEAITRQGWNPVDRGLTKLVNSVVKQVDTVAMTAIAAAVTQTAAAGAVWATSTTLIREITTAVATMRALNQGYEPDTLVVSDIVAANLTANDKTLSLLPRESRDTPIFSGYLTRLLNLDILVTPNLPVATTALVLDRKVLGGMAEEVPLTSRSIREEKLERWLIRAKRTVVPYVQEPGAIYSITSVA